MLFCIECGGALNLFESNNDKICWSCARKKDKQQHPPLPESQTSDSEELADASLCFENDMFVLKAKEGWILWSAPSSQPITIGTIMKRAHQIYKIRKKRQQNNN